MEIKPLETDEEILGKAYVHYKAWQEAYVGIIDQDYLDGRTLEMSQKMAFRAHQIHVSTLIAKDGNKVIGFADYGRYRKDDLPETGEVYALYLLKEYYGKGIGYQLMTQAVNALLNDYNQIAIWVLEGNKRAIRFYEKFGYRFDGNKVIDKLGSDRIELRMILNR